MADIIRLLPDSVANQIAAGEVIQRPASVIKELVENALDAGSTKITVFIKDAGKTLIQVIDNGKGMSDTDARLSFERHATSKILKADDLFAIKTMGFRGEALASIAAIAHVDLKTRQVGQELGTQIIIAGSEVISQESVNCSEGSNFQIKNLFYNVPARRKFLKADATEMGHIITEFQRIALGFPDIHLILYHNDAELYNLAPAKLKQRILAVFGKNLNTDLASIQTESEIVKIYGYIGSPKIARKNSGLQYFYVNNRFMKNGYFHKSVMLAFDQILAPDTFPVYFIYFDIDPRFIDVNIHPTKTEINFEDASSIFQILKAIIREAINKFSLAPSIDFDTGGMIDIPVLTSKTEIKYPEIQINQDYNPFELTSKKNFDFHEKISSIGNQKSNTENWEILYSSFEKQEKTPTVYSSSGLENTEEPESILERGNERCFQLKNKYILSPVKSGLMIIDQKRAHEQILFEYYLTKIESVPETSQQLLYPVELNLPPDEFIIIHDLQDELQSVGYTLHDTEKNTIKILGVPTFIENQEAIDLLHAFIANYKITEVSIRTNIKEMLALALSRKKSIQTGKFLTKEEMNQLIDNLFACNNPALTPEGKNIVTILKYEEIEKRF